MLPDPSGNDLTLGERPVFCGDFIASGNTRKRGLIMRDGQGEGG